MLFTVLELISNSAMYHAMITALKDAWEGSCHATNQVLKELSSELSACLTAIYRQSINSGQLPEDWRNANIAPIFKKGNRHEAVNYRPVSLTSICCKILEHIVYSHIRKHLDDHNILSAFQHGFRTQLQDTAAIPSSF